MTTRTDKARARMLAGLDAGRKQAVTDARLAAEAAAAVPAWIDGRGTDIDG